MDTALISSTLYHSLMGVRLANISTEHTTKPEPVKGRWYKNPQSSGTRDAPKIRYPFLVTLYLVERGIFDMSRCALSFLIILVIFELLFFRSSVESVSPNNWVLKSLLLKPFIL